jgi:bacteriorhodopsin
VFNLNASLMSTQKSRSRLNFQVFYISAVAAWTHWEMWRGRDWFVAAGASSFSALRQLEWAFTTPVLLVLVQHLHAFAFAELGVEMDGHGEGTEGTTERTAACTADGTPENTTKGGTSVQTSKGNASVNTSKGNTSKGNASKGNTSTGNASAYHSAKDAKRSRSEWKYDRANTTTLVSVDLMMLACGVLMPFFPGYSVTRFLLLGASISSFAFVIGHSVAALVDVTLHADVDVTDGARLLAMLSLKVVCWSAYPVIYFATESGYLTTQQQHVYYLYNDVLTKFTYSLVIRYVLGLSQIRHTLFYLSAGDRCPYIAIHETDTFLTQSQRRVASVS